MRDPDAAIASWRDTIGLQVQSDQPYADGDRWIAVIAPGAETGLTLGQDGRRFLLVERDD